MSLFRFDLLLLDSQIVVESEERSVRLGSIPTYQFGEAVGIEGTSSSSRDSKVERLGYRPSY